MEYLVIYLRYLHKMLTTISSTSNALILSPIVLFILSQIRLLTRHRQKDLVMERFIPLIPQVALHLLVWAHQPKRERRSSYTSAPLAICLHLHVTHSVPLRCAKKTFYRESHVPVKQQRGSVAVCGNEHNFGANLWGN